MPSKTTISGEGSPPDEDSATELSPRADAASPEAGFMLVVESGPAKGRSFPLDAGQPSPFLIGESPVCAVRLGDPQISRRHAALDIMSDRVRLTDLGSTNGTFLNEASVLDAYLFGGELVRVGASTFSVNRVAGVGKHPLSTSSSFGRVVGASTAMRRLYPFCQRLAESLVPVVLEGETGTGKEALAEALHDESPRANGPFIVFDCAAVPPSLAESELFGHERGAFTGAVGTRKGVFELAEGGTLLIDEIGDLDLQLQPRLLRAIERREVRRVGGDKPRKVDVRLLAATRRNLDVEVAGGRFRDDLYHRIMVTRIELPPLRLRKGDITLLARKFWQELGGDAQGPSRELLARWETDPWPGNVRALRNSVARQVALGELVAFDEPKPSSPSLPPPGQSDIIEQVLGLGLPLTLARERVIGEFERRYIDRVLAAHGGDTAAAAAASGIARRYFNLLRARQK